jgi:hypothetical protein
MYPFSNASRKLFQNVAYSLREIAKVTENGEKVVNGDARDDTETCCGYSQKVVRGGHKKAHLGCDGEYQLAFAT